MANSSQQKRMSALAQGVLYAVIVIAILGVLNFLANRYDKTYDTTSNKQFTLSEQTLKISKNLTQPVEITYWDQPSKFEGARDLLDRYKNLSPKISVDYMDADKKRTEALAAGVKTLGTIFVQVGQNRQEAKGLTEEDVTGAMVRALKGGERTACFTLGSGEHSLDDTGNDGFSRLKDLVEKNNYKTQTLKLLQSPDIPKECTIVVVGGPEHDFLPPEVTSLKNYVENGGHALFMLDPPLKLEKMDIDDNQGLADVLTSWGVTPQKDLVLDASGVGQIWGLGAEVPLATTYESQAIVRDMKDVPTGFPIARSLDVKNGDHTTVDKLFESSDNSFATPNMTKPQQGKDDIKGPLVLGAAGTYTSNKEGGNGRFVVVGCSRWVTNSFLAFNGNRDLFLNMMNWLSADEDLISIRPKEPTDRRLNMKQWQMTALFWFSVVLLPIAIVLAGVGVWAKRR